MNPRRFLQSIVVGLFYKVYVPMVRGLPLRLAAWLQKAVVLIHQVASLTGLSNRNARANLAYISKRVDCSESSRNMLRRYVRTQHENFFQYHRAVAGRGAVENQFLGLEHLDEALATGRGAVLLSLHLGLFRQLQPQLRNNGYPAALLRDTAPHYEGQVFGWLARQIAQHHRDDELRLGNETVFFSDGLAFPKIVRRLKKNQLVITMADAFMADKFETTQLLQLPLRLPTGFADVAIHGNAPIVPVMYFPGDDPQRGIVIEEPIWPEDCCDATELFLRALSALDKLASRMPAGLLTLQHLRQHGDGTFLHVGASRQQPANAAGSAGGETEVERSGKQSAYPAAETT